MCTCVVTKMDKIRNVRIRKTTKEGEISKKVQERSLKWYGYVMRRVEECVGTSDRDVCGEEKERKTEAEVDGQSECGLGEEGTVRGGDAQSGCVEATCQKHRLYTEVGEDAVEDEEDKNKIIAMY